jgi:hypothetical protein
VTLTTITCPCLKVFSKAALSAFVDKLLAYEIIPATERELYEKDAASIADAARRREVKLKQWKQEKELVTQIEVSHPFSRSWIGMLILDPGTTEETKAKVDLIRWEHRRHGAHRLPPPRSQTGARSGGL